MVALEISKEQFKSFIADKKTTLYQTIEYGNTMEKEGFDVLYVGFFEEDILMGASLILIEKSFGFKYAYAPKGFIINYNDKELISAATKAIKKFLGKQEVMAIKVNVPKIIHTYDAKMKDKKVLNENNYLLQILEELGYTHLGFNDEFESLKPRFEAEIDLNSSIYEIYANLKKSLKRKIKDADNDGIKIIKSNEDNLDNLYDLTKRKYPRSLDYFKRLHSNLKKENKIDFFYAKLDTELYLQNIKSKYEETEELSNKINNQIINKSGDKTKLINKKLELDKNLFSLKLNLIEATKMLNDMPEGIILAGVLLYKEGRTIHMIMDGYNTKYRKLSAKHLLIFRIIEYYLDQGYNKFNLGGMSDPKKESKYSGLNKFKQAWNPTVIEYLGDFELITNQAKYFMYRHAKPIRDVLKN